MTLTKLITSWLVSLRAEMDLCLLDHEWNGCRTDGRQRKKAHLLKANRQPQNEAHLEGVDGRTDRTNRENDLTQSRTTLRLRSSIEAGRNSAL